MSFLTLLKMLNFSICLILIGLHHVSAYVEYGPMSNSMTDAEDEIVDEPDTAPSDIASVSKFIKEFHRQFEEDSYDVSDHTNTDQPPESASENQTSPENNSDGAANATSTLVNCNSERQAGALNVELVNSTRLMNLLTSDPNITSRLTRADCIVVLFYARTCPFSCMAAPHFNALPRAFPAIKMAAVNAIQHHSFNTQFGIVGVPTVMLFHNGRPAAKFNDSEYTLEMFTRFITRYTGIQPEEKMFVTSADFGGPVPSVVTKETDYWLGLAWAVIAAVGGVGIARSRAWRAIVEAVQNTWREAEAQHFHAD